MKIALLGNFNVSFSTESHYALTLESMGHEVVRLQEGQITEFDLWHKVVKCNLFVWVHTHSWHQWGVEKVVATCKKRGIPTMTYHLDLWMGLGRERDMLRGPYWNLDHFFTVDALMADHLNKHSTVQGHYLPAGVFGDECYMKQGDPTKHPVVFVGSKGYHREHPYRGQLIDWLHDTYGDDFHHFGGDGKGVVRGDALNQLYADSAVVVGDSLCKDFTYANYWCVDAQTLILTREGWKDYTQLVVGDVAYTINPDTLVGEWQSVDSVFISPIENHKLVLMEGQRHNSLTTPNHKWLVETRSTERTNSGPRGQCPDCSYEGDLDNPRSLSIHRAHKHGWTNHPLTKTKKTVQFRQTSDLRTNDSIFLAAKCSGLPAESIYPDEFVELVAWVWTEGNARKGGYAGISQSHKVNQPYVERIKGCLTSLYGPETLDHLRRGDASQPRWGTTLGDRGMTTFRFNGALSKDLWSVAPDHTPRCDFVLSMTEDQLRLFVETSVDADGCRKKSYNSEGVTIAQKDSGRLVAFEMACALLGIATSRSAYPDVHLVHLKKRSMTAPLKAAYEGTAKASLVDYEGSVWCPSTKNHTWLAMRKGQVFFTGNSDRIYETTGRGGFLIHPHIDGIENEFTNDRHVVFYDFGDFEGLKRRIDYFLEHTVEREQIRRAGFEHTKKTHTYANRWDEILKTVTK